MQSENPLLADFVKMLNSAAGTFAGMSREAAGTAREKAKEVFGGLDFVSREEFETIKDIAIAAREEVDALKARIAALEGAAAAKTAGLSSEGAAG